MIRRVLRGGYAWGVGEWVIAWRTWPSLLPSRYGEGRQSRSDEMGSGGGLEFEVYFEGIDERHQPGEKFLVDGVVVVGIEGGTVGEFHDPAQFVTLGAWRDVRADEGFYEAGDLALQGADFGDDARLLLGGDAGFPAEGEGMDDHGNSVLSAA